MNKIKIKMKERSQGCFKTGDRVRVDGYRFGRGFFTGIIVWASHVEYQVRPDEAKYTTQTFYPDEVKKIESAEPEEVEKNRTVMQVLFL